jgi:hypothetical protein
MVQNVIEVGKTKHVIKTKLLLIYIIFTKVWFVCIGFFQHTFIRRNLEINHLYSTTL